MKYIISKTDGSQVDADAVYFVLRLDKPDVQGTICRALVAQYAERMHGRDKEASRAAAEVHNKGLMAALDKENCRRYEKLTGEPPDAITRMAMSATRMMTEAPLAEQESDYWKEREKRERAEQVIADLQSELAAEREKGKVLADLLK